MKKILIGFIEDGRAGGVDRYLLNFLDTVWEKEVQIDFLTNKADQELQQKLSEKNVRLFEISTLKHPLRQYRQARRLIQKYQYDVTYLNISTAIDCAAAWAAKKEKVPVRILHTHAAGNDCENDFVRWMFNCIHYMCRTVLYRTGTKFYGCSRKAGLWMFPRHIVESECFQVIFNAVNTEEFRFHQQTREQMRAELGVGNAFVIGHVGNFCYVKNYPFLIDVFAEVRKRMPDSKLLLVGTGNKSEEVKQKVHDMRMDDSVLFLGWRADVAELFQAMDVFVFPSLLEGLGYVGVEAQLSGLPVVASDTIPEEMKITEKCQFVSLQEGAGVWADVVINSKSEQREQLQFLSDTPEFDLERQEDVLKEIIK